MRSLRELREEEHDLLVANLFALERTGESIVAIVDDLAARGDRIFDVDVFEGLPRIDLEPNKNLLAPRDLSDDARRGSRAVALDEDSIARSWRVVGSEPARFASGDPCRLAVADENVARVAAWIDAGDFDRVVLDRLRRHEGLVTTRNAYEVAVRLDLLGGGVMAVANRVREIGRAASPQSDAILTRYELVRGDRVTMSSTRLRGRRDLDRVDDLAADEDVDLRVGLLRTRAEVLGERDDRRCGSLGRSPVDAAAQRKESFRDESRGRAVRFDGVEGEERVCGRLDVRRMSDRAVRENERSRPYASRSAFVSWRRHRRRSRRAVDRAHASLEKLGELRGDRVTTARFLREGRQREGVPREAITVAVEPVERFGRRRVREREGVGKERLTIRVALCRKEARRARTRELQAVGLDAVARESALLESEERECSHFRVRACTLATPPAPAARRTLEVENLDDAERDQSLQVCSQIFARRTEPVERFLERDRREESADRLLDAVVRVVTQVEDRVEKRVRVVRIDVDLDTVGTRHDVFGQLVVVERLVDKKTSGAAGVPFAEGKDRDLLLERVGLFTRQGLERQEARAERVLRRWRRRELPVDRASFTRADLDVRIAEAANVDALAFELDANRLHAVEVVVHGARDLGAVFSREEARSLKAYEHLLRRAE